MGPITPETADQIDTQYNIAYENAEGRISASIGGVVIAETDRAVIAHETHLPSQFYIPRDDFKPGILRPDERRTFCPFKGTANHWSVNLPERKIPNAGWSYERPLEGGAAVGGHVALYANIIDNWSGQDCDLDRIRSVGKKLATNSQLMDWVTRDAWLAPTARDLTTQLGDISARIGIPVMRMNVGIWSLHPQLAGTSYTWINGKPETKVVHTPRGMLQEETYLKSPERFVSEGLGGVRQRLDDDNPEFQFPIMQELHKAGGTDYVAMPLWFSDGQIHTLTLASDHPQGFSVAELGQYFEIVPVLSRLFEVHAARDNTKVLLNTYLGGRTGEKVLNGLTQRGDGEKIKAVIWFCDLRDSTVLADTLSPDVFLYDLNQFFDGVAGAILDYGGEVLRFIGDAVLAIFPINTSGTPDKSGNLSKTCYTAVEAIEEAQRRIARTNEDRISEGQQPLRYGIGLHVGEVTYGNIGTQERLEFTVIGAAANEAARIESLCKELDIPILLSETFAASFPESLLSVGSHALKGVKAEQEIFTLPGLKRG